MLSNAIASLEHENHVLRDALEELSKKMSQNLAAKPKSCQYCKNYIQHYLKTAAGMYMPIYAGHCTCGVPVCKGGKKEPKPDDTCPYFEIGTHDTKYL